MASWAFPFLRWVEARDRQIDGRTDTAHHFIMSLPIEVGDIKSNQIIRRSGAHQFQNCLVYKYTVHIVYDRRTDVHCRCILTKPYNSQIRDLRTPREGPLRLRLYTP